MNWRVTGYGGEAGHRLCLDPLENPAKPPAQSRKGNHLLQRLQKEGQREKPSHFAQALGKRQLLCRDKADPSQGHIALETGRKAIGQRPPEPPLCWAPVAEQ